MPQGRRAGSARAELFDLSYELKWIILLALFAAVVLAFPNQVTELYRIIHDERDWLDSTKLFLSAVAMGGAIWLAAATVASGALERLAKPHSRAAIFYVRMLPALLGALPLFGSALGHWIARPRTDDGVERQIGAAIAVADRLQMQLVAFALAFVAIGVALIAWSAWWWREEHRAWIRRAAAKGSGYAGLAAVLGFILLLVILFVAFPVALPRALGAVGVFGLFVVAVALNGAQLTLLSQRLRVPIIPIALLAALIFSFFNLNDNHAVRELTDAPPRRTAPPLAVEFQRWYDARPDRDRYATYPVYIVSAQGGGLFAAYHAGVFLARMEDRCPGFRHHVFAISSVSGGSFGAAAFVAALKNSPPPPPPPPPPAVAGAGPASPCPELMSPTAPVGRLEQKVSAALGQDHLAPLIAGDLFPDYTQRFIPKGIPLLDSARGFEKSFEEASGRIAPSQPLAESFLGHWSPTASVPALVVNTTDAGSGTRYLIAPFELGRLAGTRCRTVRHFPFWIMAQAKPARPRDIRLSTAASISARFPWVTPAARLTEAGIEHDQPCVNPDRAAKPMSAADRETLRLVDGGYFDNSGVETAMDIIRELASRPAAPGESRTRPVKFVLIAIGGGDIPTRSSFALGEALEPIRALASTWVSRAAMSLDRAYREGGFVTVRQVDLRSSPAYPLPLGWQLSERTQRIIAGQSGRAWDCPRLPGRRPADCVQRLIAQDLAGS